MLLSVLILLLVGVTSLNIPILVGVVGVGEDAVATAAAAVGAVFVFLRKWFLSITKFLFKFAVALPTAPQVADAAAKALDTTAAAAAEDGGCGNVLQAEPNCMLLPMLPTRPPLLPPLPQPTIPTDAMDVVGDVAPPPPRAPPMLPPTKPTPGPGRPTPSISSWARMVGKC